MARSSSVMSRVNGSTQAYLGNSRSRDTNARGNKFASHQTNYNNIRAAFGMSIP